jgi:Xaa-Pro aminopeptidase
MSEKQIPSVNRQLLWSGEFKKFIPQGWAPYPAEPPAELPAAKWAAKRREKLAALFPGERLVIPAGGLKVRNNDCDFRYRPHSAFAHLTGLGTDREPDAVLVLEPEGVGEFPAVLFFHPRVDRTDKEFYSDSRYGEMWVGQRESLAEMEALCGIKTASIDLLDNLLRSHRGLPTRVLRDADPDVTELVDTNREGAPEGVDHQLQIAVSELRLVKDEFELAEMRKACEATAVGFENVVRAFPDAVKNGRGERWVEGVFGLHARHQGNAVGYDSIIASGDHANTLHWIRNTGDLVPGTLLLMDAGVELDTLYTADVTRTLPVDGKFTPAQRQVYEAVLEAQQAGIDAATPGAKHADIHKAATTVVATKLAEWGLLPVSLDEALDEEHGGQWRRWMVHGTSHHLGLDVHDCAHARRENYKDGYLHEGMVVTVEPGIYFKSTDLMVPEELRGIGVRIEDDIAITATGCELLSDQLPRDPDAVEAWMAKLLG